MEGQLLHCTKLGTKSFAITRALIVSDDIEETIQISPKNTKYTVSQKNIPDIFSRNSRKHCRLFITFGTCVTEKASNQCYSFPPHLTTASALPEKMQ